MNAYWRNFIRTGDPNGPGLPMAEFREDARGDDIDTQAQALPEGIATRVRSLDSFRRPLVHFNVN